MKHKNLYKYLSELDSVQKKTLLTLIQAKP